MGTIRQKTTNSINAFKKNDPKTMRDVYVEVFPKIRTLVLKNSGNEDQAKDIFQEAFIACWYNIKDGKFKDDGNLEGYLFTIAKNKWTDFLRSSEFKKTVNLDLGSLPTAPEDRSTVSDDDLEDEKNRVALNLALARLGDQCRALLRLFYFERKSMEEIARETGIAPSSARNQKYRCMEKLRGLCTQIIKSNER